MYTTMATFSLQQLSELPSDVVIEHLVPLLAQPPPQRRPTLDEWGQRLLEWVLPRQRCELFTLPEYNAELLHARDQNWANMLVIETPLMAFTVLGPRSLDAPYPFTNSSIRWRLNEWTAH